MKETSGYEPYIGIDVETAMYNINGTCYIRIPFNVDAGDIGHITALTLHMRYDDGFVAYINGTEVKRVNFADHSGVELYCQPHRQKQLPTWILITFRAYINTLHAGTNILAIHGLNTPSSKLRFPDFSRIGGTS